MARATKQTWRWLATIMVIATAAFATTATMAAPAQAMGAPVYSCRFASEAPNHIGWVTLSYRGCVQPGMPVTADCPGITAYRWTGAAWQNYGLNSCGGPSQVYVYPYAAGWSWIWTQRTGWLAVRSSSVMISSGYGGYDTACCTIGLHNGH